MGRPAASGQSGWVWGVSVRFVVFSWVSSRLCFSFCHSARYGQSVIPESEFLGRKIVEVQGIFVVGSRCVVRVARLFWHSGKTSFAPIILPAGICGLVPLGIQLFWLRGKRHSLPSSCLQESVDSFHLAFNCSGSGVKWHSLPLSAHRNLWTRSARCSIVLAVG